MKRKGTGRKTDTQRRNTHTKKYGKRSKLPARKHKNKK